ncbi:MAG: hypothetical protein Q9214_004571 [Letrouitia sp. 1 TL-2023]
MAAMSSGKHDRPRKLVKRGTDSHRKHRFESFNQRVAKLKIDPLHRSCPTNVNLDSSNPTASFFRTDLERWKDLNLSESFSTFVSQVTPFCDSLPQIVHFQREIATRLMTSIEKRDSLSLEPLLSLLANFARDLGVEFEKYFSDVVKLVTSLAASHHQVEVTEWSFTCLAWLFKYLSRLLVPDLRPLFRIMAPLLGKTPQKSHTVRFVAESMSFLVRKAAHAHCKNNEPLSTIIDCIWEDVCNTSEHVWNMEVYHHGLMTLLSGAMKGVGTSLHSAGTMVYGSLLRRLDFLTCPVGYVENIIEGVTIALIHHTDEVTFRPIADMIIDHIESKVQGLAMRPRNSESNDMEKHDYQTVCSRLLMIISTVRKGSRVQDWASILRVQLRLLELSSMNSHITPAAGYRAAAAILQFAPSDVVDQNLYIFMDPTMWEAKPREFLIFCNHLCIVDSCRYQKLNRQLNVK